MDKTFGRGRIMGIVAPARRPGDVQARPDVKLASCIIRGPGSHPLGDNPVAGKAGIAIAPRGSRAGVRIWQRSHGRGSAAHPLPVQLLGTHSHVALQRHSRDRYPGWGARLLVVQTSTEEGAGTMEPPPIAGLIQRRLISRRDPSQPKQFHHWKRRLREPGGRLKAGRDLQVSRPDLELFSTTPLTSASPQKAEHSAA
jgi:hypothetical protein